MRARYGEALALAGELGLRPLIAYCHRGLGRLLERARHPDADAHLGRSAALAREMGITLWQWPDEPPALNAEPP